MNPKVDFFFSKPSAWQKEFQLLRNICIDTNLTEDLKWGCPCYTLNNSNIVLIHGFKNYCALLFFKGALLKDPENLLIQQTATVQAARQLRFISVKQIKDLKTIIKRYIFEAVEVEKAGLKVELKKTKEFEIPTEFEAVLKKSKNLKKAFESLTPGRQRAYLLYFSSAKQSTTRQNRINKCIPLIFNGKGIDDK